MKIRELRVNDQRNPLGIQLSGITFSWVTDEAKGSFQQSARLRIAGDSGFREVVYDSGEANLNSCGFSPKAPLGPGKRYYWKVSVTDDAGEQAESETAWFEGGHPEGGWKGVWICPPFAREIHPVFRRTFALERPEDLETARLYVCGLGLYEVYINGEKAGDQYLTPYFTDYRYWIQYQTYDVGSLLKKGTNVLEIYLGNGWYKGKLGYFNHGQLREYYGSRFQALADLYLWDRDGQVQAIGTDTSWEVLKSPVVLSGIYDGEVYDAQQELSWRDLPPRQICRAVQAQPPKAPLAAMTGLPVKRKEVLPVQQVIRTPRGETVLDFGQEITGYVVFWADAPEEAEITLSYGEVLQDGCFYRDNLRSARAEYTFISAGRRQMARPRFTFFGFRYVKVSGMEVSEENKGDFQAWALYSDMEETGFLTTSEEKVNRLISNTKWSQKDNFLDIPTDCPQRDERLGWTGDAQIFSAAASFHMRTPSFFRKYLRDMGYEQREKGGAVPYVVPDVLTLARQMNGEPEFDMAEDLWGEAGASVWGDAAAVIPWNLYLHYGNGKWLEEQYDNMKQWVDFMVSMDETYCGGKRLWTCGFHFGDWLSLDSEGGSREGGTDKHYIASVYYMHSASLTAKAAAVLGKDADAAYYRELSEQVRRAVRQAYVTGPGRLSISTQTAYAVGIWLDLFEEEEKAAAGETLCRLLKENGGHLATGFVGTAFLCPALTVTGHQKEAVDLLLNEEYPGWLYEVNLGATTIWERWNSLLPDGTISSTGMNSLNHYAYGVIVEWMYRFLCGLNHTEEGPGGKRMRFLPGPDRRFALVQAEYRTAAGTYRAGWAWKGDRLEIRLEVPFDCTVEFEPSRLLEAAVCRQLPAGEPLPELWRSGSYVIEGKWNGDGKRA